MSSLLCLLTVDILQCIKDKKFKKEKDSNQKAGKMCLILPPQIVNTQNTEYKQYKVTHTHNAMENN